MSDQHNKGVLGCSGDGIVRTPNLDALAANGVQFTNCYAPAPVCVPSRMSFLTSRMPSRNRVWSETALASEAPTLAHVLGLAGYETSLIGRMHFIGADQRHGFERRPIGEFTARYPGSRPKGGKPWQHYPGAAAGQFRKGVEYSGYGYTFYQYLDEQVTDAACRFLDDKRQRRGRPFFAIVGWVLPHCPYIAPKALFDYYHDRVELPEVEQALPRSIEAVRRARGIDDPPISEQATRVARAAYYGLTEVLDNNIGKVLSALHDSGLADDTLVIYLSDHGDMLGQHGCWWKSVYYEGSVGVPMIASGPEIAEPGRKSAQLSSLVDIGPTLFEMAGARHVHSHDGMSLLGCLRQADGLVEPDRMDVGELVDVPAVRGRPASPLLAVDGTELWQAFDDRGFSPPALFNLDDDPEERRDLGQSVRLFRTRRRLLDVLQRGWSPSADRASAAALRADLVDVIQRYGRQFEPDCPDTLPFPDDALERGVQILGLTGPEGIET